MTGNNNNSVVMCPKSAEKRILAKSMRRNMTSAESVLWSHLRRNQLCGLHFRRQQIIDGFIADFYCHGSAIVVEADGGIHNQQADYDELRDQIIQTRNIKVLRFTNDEILSDTDRVLALIAEAALIVNGDQ